MSKVHILAALLFACIEVFFATAQDKGGVTRVGATSDDGGRADKKEVWSAEQNYAILQALVS